MRRYACVRSRQCRARSTFLAWPYRPPSGVVGKGYTLPIARQAKAPGMGRALLLLMNANNVLLSLAS